MRKCNNYRKIKENLSLYPKYPRKDHFFHLLSFLKHQNECMKKILNLGDKKLKL